MPQRTSTQQPRHAAGSRHRRPGASPAGHADRSHQGCGPRSAAAGRRVTESGLRAVDARSRRSARSSSPPKGALRRLTADPADAQGRRKLTALEERMMAILVLNVARELCDARGAVGDRHGATSWTAHRCRSVTCEWLACLCDEEGAAHRHQPKRRADSIPPVPERCAAASRDVAMKNQHHQADRRRIAGMDHRRAATARRHRAPSKRSIAQTLGFEAGDNRDADHRRRQPAADASTAAARSAHRHRGARIRRRPC